MVQAIVYNKDEGLIRGIEQATSAIGGALMHNAMGKRKEEKYRKSGTIIDKVLEDLPQNASAVDIQRAMSKAVRDGADSSQVSDTFKTLVPLYKERMKADEGRRYLRDLFPNSSLFGGRDEAMQQVVPQGMNGAMGEMEMPQGQMMSQQGGIPGLMNPSPFGQMQPGQQTNPPMMLPGMHPNMPQAQQMTVQPSPSIENTIDSPGLGPVNRAQIDALLISPYDNIRKLGESLDRRWTEQYKMTGKENADIRKEYRQQINEYSKPYEDLVKIHSNVNKLKEAEKIIDTGKVSLDDNWTRNAIAAILEGQENPLAEFVKTPEQQKLWYLLRDALKPKEIGGSNPSTREVLIAMSSQPSPYKGQAANKYIIRNMLNLAESELHKGQEISKLRQQAGPVSFAKFQSQVEGSVEKFMEGKQKELEKMGQIDAARQEVKGKAPAYGHVWMADPEGVPRQVPVKDIKRAEEKGGTLLNGR